MSTDTDTDTDTAARGQDLAVEHLQRLGYATLARNYRTRHGVIDVVAHTERTIVFVEVTTRRGPVASVAAFTDPSPSHQLKARRMARAWLAEAAGRPRVPQLRFDGVGIAVDDAGAVVDLAHLEDCF